MSIKASGEIPETFIGFMWGEGSRAWHVIPNIYKRNETHLDLASGKIFWQNTCTANLIQQWICHDSCTVLKETLLFCGDIIGDKESRWRRVLSALSEDDKWEREGISPPYLSFCRTPWKCFEISETKRCGIFSTTTDGHTHFWKSSFVKWLAESYRSIIQLHFITILNFSRSDIKPDVHGDPSSIWDASHLAHLYNL